MKEINVRRVGAGWWKGCRLLAAEELPAVVFPCFLSDVLFRCRQKYVSVELRVSSVRNAQRLAVSFLLRCEGEDPSDVRERLDRLERTITLLCRRQGIRLSAAAQETPIEGRAGMGFFPREQLLAPDGCYVPGRYAAGGCALIDWVALADILLRHPASTVRIQLINTMLTPAETAFLHRYHDFLEKKAKSQAEQALGVCTELMEQEGKPLFFVNAFGVGSEQFVQELAAQMHMWNYQTYSFVYWATPDEELLMGDVDMMRRTMEQGHASHCLQRLCAGPARRLTHLAALEDAVRLFRLPAFGAAG